MIEFNNEPMEQSKDIIIWGCFLLYNDGLRRMLPIIGERRYFRYAKGTSAIRRMKNDKSMRRRIRKEEIILSISDETSSQLQNKVEQGITQAMRTLPYLPGTVGNTIAGAGRTISGAVSGIVMVIKAPVLTTKEIMSFVGRMRHNPKYSKQNISIEELEKNSDIKKVDEGITRDVMKHFDKSCQKYGVTYSAVVDKSNPKDPAYYIFFKGKETPVIEQALKEAYKEYVQEQAKPHISVRAKLAFFRNRVTARDQEQQDLGKEKNNNRADRQR